MFNWCNLCCILSRKTINLLHTRWTPSNITHDMYDIVGAVCSLMWGKNVPSCGCEVRTQRLCLRARGRLCPPQLLQKALFIHIKYDLFYLFHYLFIEGPGPLLCGAQYFPPVLPFVWGAESLFWHSHVEAFLFQAWSKLSKACGGAGAFRQCPAPLSPQVTMLDFQLGQSLPTAYINQVPADLLCPLPGSDPPSAGRKVFFLPTLRPACSSGWHCPLWQLQVPHTPLLAACISSCKTLDRNVFRTEAFSVAWALWLLVAPPGRVKYSMVGVTKHKNLPWRLIFLWLIWPLLSSLLETFSCSCQTTSAPESAVFSLAINPCFPWSSAFKQMMSCCLIFSRKSWGFKNKTKKVLKNSILGLGLTEDAIPFGITEVQKWTVKTFALFLLSVEVV